MLTRLPTLGRLIARLDCWLHGHSPCDRCDPVLCDRCWARLWEAE